MTSNIQNCFMFGSCNHIDCRNFCLRKYKLDQMYDMALITKQQRKIITLYLDADNTDLEEFKQLNSIKTNIVSFINNSSNLLLMSTNCGNGKTSWALKLLQAYFNTIWHSADIDKCYGLFINVPNYLLALKNNIANKDDYAQHIQAYIQEADIVIWDEMGTKGLTSYEHEQLLSALNARIANGKSNIYTTNLSNIELHEALGDRLNSRIVNNSIVINLHGADKRGIYNE